jgi:hypothetical protein
MIEPMPSWDQSATNSVRHRDWRPEEEVSGLSVSIPAKTKRRGKPTQLDGHFPLCKQLLLMAGLTGHILMVHPPLLRTEATNGTGGFSDHNVLDFA